MAHDNRAAPGALCLAALPERGDQVGWREELGFPVFRRTSTGVEPTELGVQALEGAKRILLELEQMRALKGQRPQSLRIASVYSPFFMKCFLEMRAKLGAQPQDSFQEMPPIECLQQLTSQQVDLALLVF